MALRSAYEAWYSDGTLQMRGKILAPSASQVTVTNVSDEAVF